jgi:hypothetical protein
MTIYYCLRFEIILTCSARSPYLYPSATGLSSYTPRQWIPFSSPPMTRRATVEVINPASTRECTNCRFLFWHRALVRTTQKTPLPLFLYCPVPLLQQFLNCRERILCGGKVFTEPLLRNDQLFRYSNGSSFACFASCFCMSLLCKYYLRRTRNGCSFSPKILPLSRHVTVLRTVVIACLCRGNQNFLNKDKVSVRNSDVELPNMKQEW